MNLRTWLNVNAPVPSLHRVISRAAVSTDNRFTCLWSMEFDAAIGPAWVDQPLDEINVGDIF